MSASRWAHGSNARFEDERYTDYRDLYRSTRPIVHRHGAYPSRAPRPPGGDA